MLVADKSGVLAGTEDLFVRSYARPPRLIVVGAAHISQFLAPMAALAGFEVIVIDPRRAFASAERFPGVTLIDTWPDEAFRKLNLDSTTAVVTLTHDPKIDDPALIAALGSPVFYVGALGSKRTHAKRVDRLAEAGLADRAGRIHAPVGLDLGGRSPREIAVSILSQVIQVRYKGEVQR
jgi:xanthine dehydrogenase accessory factor